MSNIQLDGCWRWCNSTSQDCIQNGCFRHHNNQLQRDAQVSHYDRPSQQSPTPQLVPQAIILSAASWTSSLHALNIQHGVTKARPSVCLTCASACRCLRMTGQAAARDRSPHNLSVKTTLEEEIERAESILSRWSHLLFLFLWISLFIPRAHNQTKLTYNHLFSFDSPGTLSFGALTL